MIVPDPHAALRAHFGFPAFRPGQEEAVRAALEGRDVLVVMPTGAGKSLCYQLPALMREDLTLVVSPLVSLMQDQVEALERRAPGRVALISGQQSPGANDAAVARAVAGEVRVLYVAPERFSSPGFARALKPAQVGLFVVDEAHCVSQWGHDFRPDYFRLADAARWLGATSIVASTATATPSVAADVVARLGLRRPVRVSTGFDRPNLSWAVVPSTPQAKERQLVAVLSEPGALPAIVYAGTRRDVDALGAGLASTLDRPVVAYHAGLPREARSEAQRRFMSGAVDVVVATNAFGMGVDKADVRTVVHASVPPSVEAYYQEAGRAGRDGRPARAVLLAAPRDKGLHVFFIQRAEVTDELVARVAAGLEAAVGGPPAPGAVAPVYDVGLAEVAAAGSGAAHAAGARAAAPAAGEADRVRAVVGVLARAGVVQPAPAPVDRLRGRLLSAFDGRARAACRRLAADAQRARWAQYRTIWGFVETPRCRRAAILAHFGDDVPPRMPVPPAASAASAAPASRSWLTLAPRSAAGGSTAVGGDDASGSAAADRGDARGPAAGTLSTACCDVCDPAVVPAALRVAAAPDSPVAPGSPVAPEQLLPAAVLALVAGAEPPLGPVRAVEVLRGGRSRELLRHRYDGLSAYGTYAQLSEAQVGAAVSALVAEGRLVLSDGIFPKLELPAAGRAAA